MSISNPSMPTEDLSRVGIEDHTRMLRMRTDFDARMQFLRRLDELGTTVAGVLDGLVQTIAEVIFDLCVIHLVDDRGKQIRAQAVYHPNPTLRDTLRKIYESSWEVSKDGVFARVIATKKPYFNPRWHDWTIGDRSTDPGAAPGKECDLNIHSFIVAPMATTESKVVGILSVGRQHTRMAYDEDDVELLRWMSTQAAMLVEMTRLQQSMLRASRYLQSHTSFPTSHKTLASHELRIALAALRRKLDRLESALDDDDRLNSALTAVLSRLDGRLVRLLDLVERLRSEGEDDRLIDLGAPR